MIVAFASVLRERIEREYAARGDALGWRLLYSPASVLEGSDVAFIGLNPGGTADEPDHSSFACPPGVSAYTSESWKGRPPGEEALQRQVRLLFAKLGVEPASVLAGNLVPFRSPDWDRLRNPTDAVKFGREIWTEIVAMARPKLVVTMGRRTSSEVAGFLGVRERHVNVGWGAITATIGETDALRFVGLPHLSRFRLFGRDASRAALDDIFS